MSDYRFLVKGAYFRGAEAREVSDSLQNGDIITVRRDYDNEYDEFACTVHYEDVHIGYVQAEISFAIAHLFDEGELDEVKGKIIGRVSGNGSTTYPEVELSL